MSYDLGKALKALRALLENPDDTAQAFRIIEALPGGAPARNLRRFAKTEVGARLLAERGSLLAVLGNARQLSTLPANSLGRAYLDFMRDEGISADGLVEASAVGHHERRRRPPTTDAEVLEDRMRDSHDLWHVVTGYRGDLVGEAALLAFAFAQTRHPGVGLMVLGSLLQATLTPNDAVTVDVDPRRVIVEGFWRGLRCEWLVAQDWESLLPQPLDEVRKRLRLGTPPHYTPVRASEIQLAA
ncbi:MAG TPA: Coq4 family protein [Polyangiaceae bacterium]|jgi:ubiquinone biosynthesis protein COQ4|nr:Coq4 family protein [Polyangiaceae bacterium]